MADHDTSGAPHVTAHPLDLSPCSKELFRDLELAARAGALGRWGLGSTAAPQRAGSEGGTVPCKGQRPLPRCLQLPREPGGHRSLRGNASGGALKPRLSLATASREEEFLPIFSHQSHPCLCRRTYWSGLGWVK